MDCFLPCGVCSGIDPAADGRYGNIQEYNGWRVRIRQLGGSNLNRADRCHEPLPGLYEYW